MNQKRNTTLRSTWKLVLATLFFAANAGCYLSHQRSSDGGVSDARPDPDARVDAGADAGRDAGPTTCCTNWRFERRVGLDAFPDRETVTPRLILLGGIPAVVVTGPDDPVGPSGAYLVRLSRTLATQSEAQPVTSGSFTWGQPVSTGDTGDSLAVCWGTDTGDVVSIYDPMGRPVLGPVVMDTAARSPCIDGAFSAGHIAYVYASRAADGSDVARVRILDGMTLASRATVDLPVTGDSFLASLVALSDGFAVAITGTDTRVVVFDTAGEVRGKTRTGPSRRVRLVLGRGGLQLLRVFERDIAPGRREDVWTLELFDAAGSTLPALAPLRELDAFEPSPSPSFAAATNRCGAPILGTNTPSLVHVLPTELSDRLAPSATGPIRGDTSVLVLDDDAYIAFSSGSPESRVQIDHWVCGD